MKKAAKGAHPPPTARHPRMGEVPALLRQAVALHQQGHVPQAQSLYEEILGIHPRHFEALQFLGISATDTGNPQLAVEFLDRAIAVRANVPEAHYNRANALQDLGRKPEALAGYDRAVALAPNFADAWYNRGILQRDLGQPEAALASLERALHLMPDDPEAHFNRALALKDLGRLGEAIASYDRAIALRPGHPESHYNRGNA
ncbi:MAG: tetratricopeptide repeat protein, partial [Burkholderiales bacterium]